MALLTQVANSSLTVLALCSAYGVLLGRLFWVGLYRKYPALTFYVGFQLVRTAVGALVTFRTKEFALLYFFTQPLIWILYVLMVFELFQHVLRARPGIASFSKRFMGWALCAAGGVSGATLLLDLQGASPESVLLENFVVADRVIHSSLLVFLLLLTVFLSYFPVPLHRNAKIHAAVFSFYFFAKTVLLLFRNMFGAEIATQANLVLRLVSIICLLCWVSLLSKAGEQETVRSSWLSNPELEEKLTAQLDAINNTLLRSAKE